MIGHKLDTQEALTKSNQVNMELQTQLDSLIEGRDFAEKVSLPCRLINRLQMLQSIHSCLSCF